MELILWRHADAEDGADDMARRLTAKGERQAAAMATWLRANLPSQHTLMASPAVRAQQTAAALDSETDHWKSVGMKLSVSGLSDKKVSVLQQVR